MPHRSPLESIPQLIPGSEALVLAAGAGSRFGGGKLLADWRGRPLIVSSVATALQAPVEHVTVVLGFEADAVAATLAPIRDLRLRIVANVEWELGLSSSLRAGLESLPETARYAVIFLGDMPLVPGGVAAQLLAVLKAGAPVALTRCEGLPAHPVAFNRTLFDRLCRLDGDGGARRVIAEIEGAVFCDVADHGSLFDVNYRVDLSASKDTSGIDGPSLQWTPLLSP
jgi:molybdenum cofactor cytidylyltransferase